MATQIYSDTFTVGADAELDAYDADWVKVSANQDDVSVIAANDRLEGTNSVGNNADYTWTGQTVLEERIQATLNAGSAWSSLTVRGDLDMNNYLAEWDSSSNAIILYRATGFTGGSGGSWTQVAFGGTVASSTTYTGAYLKATGTNPVELEGGDDTNGAAAVTYSDSNAARHQSGQPGISMATNSGGWIDNVEIWDEADSWIPEQDSPAKLHFHRPSAVFR
jgi:hypothetical protein